MHFFLQVYNISRVYLHMCTIYDVCSLTGVHFNCFQVNMWTVSQVQHLSGVQLHTCRVSHVYRFTCIHVYICTVVQLSSYTILQLYSWAAVQLSSPVHLSGRSCLLLHGWNLPGSHLKIGLCVYGWFHPGRRMTLKKCHNFFLRWDQYFTRNKYWH